MKTSSTLFKTGIKNGRLTEKSKRSLCERHGQLTVLSSNILLWYCLSIYTFRSGWTRTYSFKWARTHTAGVLRQKSAPVITGMQAAGKTHPATGENRFGNTKHMLSWVSRHTVPVTGMPIPVCTIGNLNEDYQYF